MAKEKINVLYTVDDKEFPSKDYMNALEKMKTLSKEYEELKRVEGKQDQREEKSQLSKIYAKWHTLFKNNCLAPFPSFLETGQGNYLKINALPRFQKGRKKRQFL